MITVVSWNIAMRLQAVEELLTMGADVALLQEVGPGALDRLRNVGGNVAVSPQDPWEPWPREHYGSWPMVVQLSDRVEVEWFRQILPSTPSEGNDEIAVSNVGIIAAARVNPLTGGEPFIAVSMYARWFRPHPLTGKTRNIHSDRTAHLIMSDLAAFIWDTDLSGHRILAAGDLNNIYGATEDNRLVWYERDRGVFDRMNALGMEFMGPQHPGGRRADPVPQGLPEDTRNVPTYHTTRGSPATAENQLDYVFASRGFHRGVRAQALNRVDEWGSSDHCRLMIEVDG
jgi:endonuclease/exonuclease/phosphatase family metal-dependent hydrolase